MFAMGPAFFGSVSGSYATLTLTGTYPAATVGTPYSQALSISGGLSPYSLTGGTGVASGSLPAGLALSIVGSTLVLSGTPTTAATATFTASVTSTDGQTATSAQSVVVVSSIEQAPFSTTNKESRITLANSNYDCIANAPTKDGGMVLTDTGKSSGKFYAEFLCTALTSDPASDTVLFGLHAGTGTLTNYIGQDTDGWSALAGGTDGKQRVVYHNGALPASSTATAATAVTQNGRIAVDLDAGKIWLAWFGDLHWRGPGGIGTPGDPALGTSPTFTFTPSGAYYLAASPRAGINQLRILKVAAWINAAPSGFGVWT